MHHADLYEALLRCGASISIVMTLKMFYADLRAKVHLWEGAESRHFAVQRGVRQGDPLSTLLFNLVLNEVLQEVRVAWGRRGCGTEVGSLPGRPRLTRVAFADDCALVARSWLTLKRMMLELRAGLQTRGLSLHPTKRQVRTNVEGWGSLREMSFPLRSWLKKTISLC